MNLIDILEKKSVIKIILILGREGEIGFNNLQIELGINTSSLTNRLVDLEESGLVDRKCCPIDSRCKKYKLSIKGYEIYKKLSFLS